jgi:TolB protein
MSDDLTHREGPLEGWKEISSYLKRDESTARRWEREEGLPVRRHEHKKRSSVYAYPRELEAWRTARGPEGARSPRRPRPTSVWMSLAAAAVILFSGGDGFRSVAEAHDPDRRTPSPALTVRELMRSGELPWGEVSDPTIDPWFAISGDGQVFVYTDWRTGDLATKNMATAEKRGLYGVDWRGDSEEWFQTPVMSPNEERVAFVRYPQRTGGTTRIEVDSIEGGNRETVHDFTGLANVSTHDWSPDGENILLSIQAEDRSVFLATLSLRDKALQRLVTLDWEAPHRAQYSPDGGFIAYDSTKGGDRKIYLISADGAQERVLVGSTGQDDSPLWTRDGRFVLFRSDRSGQWDLYTLGMENGRPTGPDVFVKSNLGAASFLQGVTTDGQLFVHEMVGGRDVAITERINKPAKTVQVRILPKVQTTENRSPAFAPDGKRLAYLAGAPGLGQTIRITDLEGRILKDVPLEHRFSTFYPPRFSPDGKKLGLRVYEAGEAKVMVLSAETGAPLKVFSPLEEEGYARPLGWSRDGRLLYAFVTPPAGRPSLAAIDVETERVVESIVLSKDVGRARLSPSGEYLLMLASPDAPAGRERMRRLMLRSLEDGSEKVLREGISIRFGWDFDSRQVFYKKDDGDSRLYSLSIDTNEEMVLVDDMGDLDLVSVSPDGRYWALHNGDRDSRIWVLENFLPEGTEQIAAR